MSAVSIDRLVKRYADRTAVDELSLSVNHGEVVGLLGPNGAGKSTTIGVLCGLLRADSGSVRIEGVSAADRRARRGLGVVFQDTELYDDLTAWENLVFHARLYGLPRAQRRARITQALDTALLQDCARRRVSTFSGGMRRRLALARSLMHDPSVLLLDEPTLGIDVQARNAIWDRIRQLRDDGRAVLLCTNYMEEADHLSDRVVVLDEGRVIAQGTPRELKARTAGSPVVLTLATVPRQLEQCLVEFGARDVTAEGEADGPATVTLRLPEGSDALPRVLDHLNRESRVLTVSAREPSMNDVFLSLTGRTLRD